MTPKAKTILPAGSEPQLDEVREFLCTLDQSGQKSFLDFIQGARFMQHLMTAPSPPDRDSA